MRLIYSVFSGLLRLLRQAQQATQPPVIAPLLFFRGFCRSYPASTGFLNGAI